MRFKSSALTVVTALFLVGCSDLIKNTVEKPKVDLETVGLQNVGGAGATVVFGVKVHNPNPFKLKVDGLDYDVEIGGKPVSQGAINQPAEVEANGTSLINVPVSVKYSDIFTSISDFLGKGTSPYTIKGKARLAFFNIPFTHSGELKLKK